MTQTRGIRRFPVALAAAAVLAGCATDPSLEQVVIGAPVERIDFSGHWEMDYRRSDDVQEKLTTVIREMNRLASATGSPNASRRTVAAGLGGGANVVALARLADLVSRPETLEILQDQYSIEVQRDADYAFTCDFRDGIGQQVATPFGNELCGWDGRNMVFHLTLPDGVVVYHRLTLSADRENLHIATRVSDSSSSFTMSRFYNRYEPLPTTYRCEETFSRKRVCSARPPD